MNVLQKRLLAVVAAVAVSNLYAVQFEIMPTVGKKIANKDTTLDDSKVLMGIRGTAYVTPNTGIQLTAESSLNNPTIGGGDTDIERLSVNGIYEGGNAKVRPYVTAGVGYEWTHGNTVQLTDDDSQPYYNAGVGVKFGLKKNLSLVTEVKGMHKAENGDNDIIGTVGLGMKIGAPEEKKPACAPAKKVLSLDEFSRMCKTKQPAPQPAKMVQAPVEVQQMQHEPAVVESETTCVVESAPVEEESVEIPTGYYVQMAALFKSSGAMLTSKLERKNYPYVVYNTKRGGRDVALVLVGPYHSRKEASVAKRYLRRLSRGAFVKKFP